MWTTYIEEPIDPTSASARSKTPREPVLCGPGYCSMTTCVNEDPDGYEERELMA